MYEKFADRERKFIFLEETESTNNDIKAMLRGTEEPLFAVVCAQRQAGGRGRLGRNFFSPAGGLYFSVSLPLAGNEKNIPFITLLAGLCVCKAIEELTGAKTELKWPNDIYFNSKKLGGILCELVSGRNITAVVGIGINLDVERVSVPSELTGKMTSFTMEGIPVPDKKVFIGKITEKLDDFIYENGELYKVRDVTVTAIRESSCSIGKRVKYTVGDTVTEGIITNILKTGAAEITLFDGTVKEIFCGEITQ